MNKYKTVMLVSFIVLIISILLLKFNLIDLSLLNGEGSESVHFNLITTNAVLAGFMFSSLSLIIGVSDTKTIVNLERGSFMGVIYKSIFAGIIFSFISIILSLFMIFIKSNLLKLIETNIQGKIELYEKWEYILETVIPLVEIGTLIIALLFFIVSVIDISFIIRSIRKKILRTIPNKESVKETIDLIRK